jgi:uncharacterized SAM-dependent methyltransferase
MNRELGADFDLDAFRFRANWDDAGGAVRSYLVAERAQRVRIPLAEVSVEFGRGDAIHTESSYKFSRDEIVALASRCGYTERVTYTDAGGRYALSLLIVA